MTDKQIIIDGCDVSECLFYQSNFEEDYDVKIKHFCSNWHNSCESANNSNCYFKQLARKTQECEELKKANQHIDTNRQCKGSKLKRIEELISDCETGYTDEFIQKIYGIIQEPEPTVNDYSITDRYRKALKEIEEYINSQGINHKWNMYIQRFRSGILDIINKAKDGN